MLTPILVLVVMRSDPLPSMSRAPNWTASVSEAQVVEALAEHEIRAQLDEYCEEVPTQGHPYTPRGAPG